MTTLPTIPAPRFYSLVSELAASVTACNTVGQYNALVTSPTFVSAFSSLGTVDRDYLRGLMSDRRLSIRGALAELPAFWRNLWSPIATATVAYATAPRATAVATTIQDDLSAIAANAATNAAGVRRRGQRGPNRTGTPAQVAAAVATARAAGERLAGYSGQIVQPGDQKGIGTMIVFGKARQEYDATSDRMRQALIPWSAVESAIVAAGFDADTLGSDVTMVAALGQATKILNHSGYIARNVRNLGQAKSAWIIGRVDVSADSDTLGDRECLISLASDGTVTLSDPNHTAASQVVAEYRTRIAANLVESSDLRARIERALVVDFGVRNTDLGLYASPYHTPRVMDLIVALRPIAGRKIYASAYTDTATLSEALTDSFDVDLRRLESDVTEKVDALKKIAGATLIERIERLKAECAGLARILGTVALDAAKARLNACDALVNAALDATSQRAANLELS